MLQRLPDIIFILAAENMSLRGHHEIQGDLCSGNFLALAGLVAKYDPVLKELLDKPKESDCYLSPRIHNEVIALLGKTLRQHLIKEIQEAPFFSVIGDSTKRYIKSITILQLLSVRGI